MTNVIKSIFIYVMLDTIWIPTNGVIVYLFLFLQRASFKKQTDPGTRPGRV
jgi:hypothetical protein